MQRVTKTDLGIGVVASAGVCGPLFVVVDCSDCLSLFNAGCMCNHGFFSFTSAIMQHVHLRTCGMTCDSPVVADSLAQKNGTAVIALFGVTGVRIDTAGYSLAECRLSSIMNARQGPATVINSLKL